MIRSFLFATILAFLAACERNGSDTELVASAKARLEKRDLSGAVIQLKNALDRNPKSAPARLLLGSTLLAQGDPLAALIELRKAQDALAPEEQVVPEIARAMLDAGEAAQVVAQFRDKKLRGGAAEADLKSSLGAAYALQGDPKLARAAAAEALQAQPGHPAAVVLLARLDVLAGDVSNALRMLDELLARDPGNTGAGLLKGGILLRARNEPDAAIAAFRNVRTAHPASIPAQIAIVNILVQQNKVAEARTELEQLKKIGSKHPDTLYLQAQFAFADGDYKTSREITERLLAAMPDNVRVLVLAGAAEYRAGRTVQAQGLLGRALKNAPNQTMTRQLLAQTYLRAGEPDKALQVLQPLIDTPQADATSLSLAGEAYLQAGDGRLSEIAFQRAAKVVPEDAGVRTSLALALFARGETGPAIAQLEAIAQDDGGTRADLALVSARLRQQDIKGAMLAVDALVRKRPNDALPLVLRGRVLGQQGDLTGAAASFEQALAKEPRYYPAVAGLAAIDVDSGRPERARKRFEDLVQADPQNSRARLALARLDIRLQAPESKVEAQLKEAAKVDPSEPVPHLVLIDRLLANGDTQGALAAAQDASTALPNDLAIMDALGRAQLAAGDSQRAVTIFRRLAGLQPKNPLHRARLADAHLAGKDRVAAAQALQQALTIDPGNLMALRGQAILAVLDKRPQDGIAIARSIQQRSPKDAVGFALEGELEASIRQWTGAAAAYRAALQRSRSTDLAIRLHGCLAEGGKRADADRMAADWLAENPRDVRFLHYLGDAAFAAKDWATAEARYRAVVGLQPRNAAAINNIAWLLATQRKSGATALAEQANALLPERPAVLDTLALAQEAEGQLSKAVETQKRAVELDPKNPARRLRLARLLVALGDKSAAREELDALARLGRGFDGQAEVAALLKRL